MSSGAATAASWQETAPSVSAPTALRSARTEQAAEVRFQEPGGGFLPLFFLPHTNLSFCPQPDFFKRIGSGCWVYENHLSAGRALCMLRFTTSTHTHASSHCLDSTHLVFVALSFNALHTCHRPGFQQTKKRTLHIPRINNMDYNCTFMLLEEV